MEQGRVGRWLDGVARHLGRRVSRRAGLRGTAGVGAGVLAGLAGTAATSTAAAPVGAEVCLKVNKTCANRSFRCCGKATCKRGRCRCSAGHKRCQGKCIPTQRCCGGCPDGSTCVAGTCTACGGGGACLIFATSSRHQGDLGGLAGADAICQARAAEAALSGTYMAWLSTTTIGPADRMVHSTTPYVRTDGVELAANWAGLTSGTLSVPLNRDENGARIGPRNDRVWTSATIMGTPTYDQTRYTCEDWTTDDFGGQGGRGSASDVDPRWTQDFGVTCSDNSRLYCVQQTS